MPVTDSLQPKLDALADCLQALVNSNQYVDPDSDPITVQHLTGDSVEIENCCPGYAWIRVVRAYPTVAFPSPVVGRLDCPPPSFAAEIEFGIARCTPTYDPNGAPLTAEQLTSEALTVGVDRSIMFQALTCCATANPIFGKYLSNVSWTPISTLGGCMGGVANFTIMYSGCCD